MKGWMRARPIRKPLTTPTATPDRMPDDGRRRDAVIHHDRRRHDADQADDRALRQVEPAHEKRECLARRQDQQRRALHEDVGDVLRGQEVGACNRIDDEHHDQREARPEQRRIDPEIRHGAIAAGFAGDGHGHCPCVMASTMRLADTVLESNSATMRPSRIASVRSPTASTSSRSEETMRMARPWSASRSIRA